MWYFAEIFDALGDGDGDWDGDEDGDGDKDGDGDGVLTTKYFCRTTPAASTSRETSVFGRHSYAPTSYRARGDGNGDRDGEEDRKIISC